MKTSGCLLAIGLSLFGVAAHANDIKPFVFGGPSYTWAWDGPPSYSLNGGVGLKFRVSSKFEIGPVITVGDVFPKGKPSAFAGQANVWGFYHLTPRFSLFGGPGETAQFPRTGTLYLPTMTAGFSLQFRPGWSVAIPLSVTRTGSHGGFSIGPRLVYTFGGGKR